MQLLQASQANVLRMPLHLPHEAMQPSFYCLAWLLLLRKQRQQQVGTSACAARSLLQREMQCWGICQAARQQAATAQAAAAKVAAAACERAKHAAPNHSAAA